ncbi:MAG TPA: polymer-forming cytoskeletal protein [Candidatus Limnocylindria bacterium]|nr:polymer-forming cytoskeletal protein [Candidatus Limnocylindria bacterium]
MFNTGVRSDVLTEEAPQTAAAMPDAAVREADANRKLQFEGTVEVDGTFTGQMLNALFGPDSQVNGKLRFEGAVQIDGTFNGSITTNDLLIIGERAKIGADISCGSAIVSGEVTGNIKARDSVELHAHARVKGDILSPTLAIDKGAVFDGSSKMAAAPTSFDRRGRSGRTS